MNVGLPLPVDEASQLAARTIFSTREIQSLYKRFKELDISGNNILEYEVYSLELACSFFNLEVLLAATLLVLGFLELTLNFHLSFLETKTKTNKNLVTQECLAVDELRANPFAPRICELFSEDGSGSLTFTNFLDMKSAFSKKASPGVRVVWAFALWDFDGDDLIGIADVKCGVDLITNSTTYINETALPLKEDDLLEMLDPYQLEEVS